MRAKLYSAFLGACIGLAVILALGQWAYPWLADPGRGVPGFDARERPADGRLGDAACIHCHDDIPRDVLDLKAASVAINPTPPPIPAGGEDEAWTVRSGSPTAICGPEGACYEVRLGVGSGKHRRGYLLTDAEGNWLRWERDKAGESLANRGVHYAAEGARVGPGRRLEPTQVGRCLECHASGGRAPDGTPNLASLDGGPGCESCHGPGWDHVARVRHGQTRMGLRLVKADSAMDKVRACGACHGNPEQVGVQEAFVAPFRVADMPAFGLLMSKCETVTEAIDCGTCHKPHAADGGVRESARQACLDCHAIGGERTTHTCPKEPEGKCLGCHMERIEPGDLANRPYFTDHWIRIPGKDPAPKSLTTHPVVRIRSARFAQILGQALDDERISGRERGLVLLRLGTVRGMSGDGEGAIAALEEARELISDSPWVHYNLGNIFLSMGAGKSDQSLEAFRKALFLSPDHVMARIRMAEVYRRMGIFDEAEDHLREAARVRPDNAVALRNLGVVLFTQGKHEAAWEVLKDAVEKGPEYEPGRRDYAVACQKLNRFEEALEQWEWLAQRNPKNREAQGAVEVLRLKVRLAEPKPVAGGAE